VTTTPVTSQYRGRAPKSIGLWGAPQSGKTTFLAALYIAVNRSLLDLNIFGVDDRSTDFMINSTHTLTSDRKFPAGTQVASSYSWTVNMNTEMQVMERGRFGRANTTSTLVQRQFNIDLRDAPGGFFQSQMGAPQPAQQPQQRRNLGGATPAAAAGLAVASPQADMMDYLAGCDGLLLLIDPVREQKYGDAHEYFQGTLLRIAQRRMASMPPGSRLPHHVAVCITKFDHPDVYGFARLRGYRTYDENDPYLFPQVQNSDAENFFTEFCLRSPTSEADMLCSALRRYFNPDRLQYFVSSSIGFYLGQSSRFRDDDPENSEDRNGIKMIRGQIHPINTLEPILWLGERITAAG
jgi:hypothetical protein